MNSRCAVEVTLGHFNFTKHHFISSLFEESHTFDDIARVILDKYKFSASWGVGAAITGDEYKHCDTDLLHIDQHNYIIYVIDYIVVSALYENET